MAGDQLLFLKLAEALGKPSKTYQAATTGLGIPQQALEGYEGADDLVGKIKNRKLDRQNLAEALGGNVPERVRPYSNINVRTVEKLGGLKGLADITDSKTDNWRQKFDLQQDAIMGRQKQRQDFIKSMIGAKGNKDAVNQAKNAIQGIDYVDQLWDRYDKLGELQKAGAGTPVLEKAFPEINTLKANIKRTAGFAEGGKALTGPELGIIVDSFLPTTYETSESKKIKKQIAHDYYAGTIDMFQAAQLLGPAGAKLKDLAAKKKQEATIGNTLLNQEAGGEADATDPFAEEGLQ